jgi:CHAD domain-containing protein
MEVEAKFAIPDRDTMVRLKQIVRLGAFTPGEAVFHRLLDRYLDTATRALYQSGYACRIRSLDDLQIVTVKGLGKAESAIHERFESELIVSGHVSMDPKTWPEGDLCDLVCSLTGDALLEELFVVEQVRHVRELREGERLVAELSVDELQIDACERQRSFCILEVELLPDGEMEDLHILVAHLAETWGLVAEPRSKFHLGLALLEETVSDAQEDEGRLSPTERAQLEHILDQVEDEGTRKRARLILGWAQRISVQEMSAQIGISRSWAYELLKRFREERMSMFPADLVPSAVLGPTLEMGIGAADTTRVGDTFLSRPDMTIAEMCDRFQVDMAHARCVADHALALFDATAEIHKLGAERRRLLEVMGVLHNVGLESDPERHHIAGRDIISDHPLHELSEIERRMLAAAVYLHRKPIKRKRLRAQVVTSLPPGIRGDALALTSLVRMADGLDYSQGQNTIIEQIHVASAAIHVMVSGPTAEVDVARAQVKSDLWERLFDVPFFFSTREQALAEPNLGAERQEPVQATRTKLLEQPLELGSPGLLPDDSMSEAGRKVLRFHFLRMLKHEPGTRIGEDIEELHDMRVATRRMRAAFRVFGSYFKARAVRPYIVGLRRTARALGQVRDLDVFMQKAHVYLETLPPDCANDLDPLLDVWQTQREQARKEMLAFLDGAKYHDFVEAFQLFLETPEAGVPKMKGFPPRPIQVRHVAPQLIYMRWADVQAFGRLLDGASVPVLHALRIECKRLRYTLEFFREVLAPEAKQVIREVVQLQDHLGNLNDADVANALLSDFLFSSSKHSPTERVIAPGVVAYLAVKQRELQTLVATFSEAWAQFNRPEVRSWLSDAIAVL